MPDAPLVCVVDDDESLCEALERLMQSAGLAVRTFPTSDIFLASGIVHEADCIVVDYTLQGMNGLTLQRELKRRGVRAPVIFATGVLAPEVWDLIQTSGAFAAFAKPPDVDALLDEVLRAVAQHRSQ